MTIGLQTLRSALPDADIVALGEPTHGEPELGSARTALIRELAESDAIRSIALETCRSAAVAVDRYVRPPTPHTPPADLDTVLATGFTHGFGRIDANRHLVAWLRDHNAERSDTDRIAFHGIDAPTENTSAPSPRPYLRRVADYLGLDLDPTVAVGDDPWWSADESVLDPDRSKGDTVEAARLRAIADDLAVDLLSRAPELVAETSFAEWCGTRAHLDSARALLRYHRVTGRRGTPSERMGFLSAARAAIMAENLAAIREIERPRGRTLVAAHNLHLRRSPSVVPGGGGHARWSGLGAIAAATSGDRTVFVATSLGRSTALDMAAPAAGTVEHALERIVPDGGLVTPGELESAPAHTRTDAPFGHFPLDRSLVDDADLILHVRGADHGDRPRDRR